MKLDKDLHNNICKYLWGKQWQSWYNNFCLRWNNKYIDDTTYRTKTAFMKQVEVDNSAETDSQA